MRKCHAISSPIVARNICGVYAVGMPKAKRKTVGTEKAESDGWISTKKPAGDWRLSKRVRPVRKEVAKPLRVSPTKETLGAKNGKAVVRNSTKWNVSPKKDIPAAARDNSSSSSSSSKWRISPAKYKYADEKRVIFQIDREEEVPLKLFTDLVRVGGGLGIRGRMLPAEGDVSNRAFYVELEGTPDNLNKYWSYVQIVSVVIGDISSLSWEDADPPRITISPDDGNFTVQHWCTSNPTEAAEDKAAKGGVYPTEESDDEAGCGKADEDKATHEPMEKHYEDSQALFEESQSLFQDSESILQEGQAMEEQSQSILSRVRRC